MTPVMNRYSRNHPINRFSNPLRRVPGPTGRNVDEVYRRIAANEARKRRLLTVWNAAKRIARARPGLAAPVIPFMNYVTSGADETFGPNGKIQQAKRRRTDDNAQKRGRDDDDDPFRPRPAPGPFNPPDDDDDAATLPYNPGDQDDPFPGSSQLNAPRNLLSQRSSRCCHR